MIGVLIACRGAVNLFGGWQLTQTQGRSRSVRDLALIRLASTPHLAGRAAPSLIRLIRAWFVPAAFQSLTAPCRLRCIAGQAAATAGPGRLFGAAPALTFAGAGPALIIAARQAVLRHHGDVPRARRDIWRSPRFALIRARFVPTLFRTLTARSSAVALRDKAALSGASGLDQALPARRRRVVCGNVGRA